MNQPDLKPLGASIGATIGGLDLNQLNEDSVAFIQRALNQYLVVFFHDQSLDAQSLLNLAARFGKPVPYPFTQGVEGYPEVVEVKKLPNETINFGGVWHSDTAYLDQPAMGAMLYGIDIPEKGGDTLFADMYAVYESLSDGMQQMLRSLWGVNEADKAAIAATRPGQPKRGLIAEHPVIRRHPDTGRPLLYVNRAHTTRFKGLTEVESAPLLNYLFDQISAPEFSCRFRWAPGSLAFWDNRACQHYPLNDYHGELRRMLRVSLAGEQPCLA